MTTEKSSEDKVPFGLGTIILAVGLVSGVFRLFVEAVKFWGISLSSVHSFAQFVSFACGFVLAMLCGVSVDLALEIIRKRHQSS